MVVCLFVLVNQLLILSYYKKETSHSNTLPIITLASYILANYFHIEAKLILSIKRWLTSTFQAGAVQAS